jgi:prevent-host-death family protein
MTTTIDVNEAQQQLAELLELAKAGQEIIIADGSTPVARLIAIAPAAKPAQPRVAGLHQGAARVSDDFDQPLPDEFWMGSS